MQNVHEPSDSNGGTDRHALVAGELRPQECEGCGLVDELVCYSAQFEATLCAKCVADRYPSNGASPDDEVTTWNPLDLTPILEGGEDLNPPPAMLAKPGGF